MDPREMEALVQRLVQNPHDQDAINQAHQAGQSDPKSYAMLLEKVGTATSEPSLSCHWLTEAASVWSITLGDAHRAARALMIAIDRDPTQPAPAERLAELYREKGDAKALVALLERRAKALTPLALQDPSLRGQLGALHEELGRLWAEAPLSQPRKAIENYRRAVEYDPSAQYAIYALRELHKAAEEWLEAIPYFALELRIVDDRERQIALYQDEGEVRRNAGDLANAAQAFRNARSLEGGQDPTLRQLLGTVVLERVQGGQPCPMEERAEAALLFVSLAEDYPGEHGLSYSLCALELEPGNDRAVQLAMYYADQLGRSEEVAPLAAGYVQANPSGAMAADAQALAQRYSAVPPSPPAPAAARQEAQLARAAAPSRVATRPTPAPAAAPAAEEAPAEDASPAGQVAALLDQAQTLARKARKNEAATKYREVLTLDPINTDAIAFLEGYLKQLRKFADLRDLLLTASGSQNADVEQRLTWLREVAGMSEAQLRDAEGAINAWRAVLEIDPADEAGRTSLKRLLERGNRWDDLASVLEQEAELETDIEARITLERNIAKLHEQKRKDPVAAGQAWARIAALAPEDDSAIDTALGLLERGKRPDLAAQVITEALPSVKDDALRADLLKRLGELRRAAGDALGAGEAFSEAASITKSADLWEAAEQSFAAADSFEQAATAAGERAQLASEDAEKATLFALEASYLSRAGDEASALLRLEQATELAPANDEYAASLEARYESAERFDDLVQFLLRRAERLTQPDKRASLRRRAAELQREKLGDADAARETLIALLADGDDIEALRWLVDDAEGRGDAAAAVDFLARLGKAVTEPSQKIEVLMREAALTADALSDPKEAIDRYELVLDKLDPAHEPALERIAELYERLEDPRGTADALERRLKIASVDEVKVEIANKLADLYDGPLDDAKNAVRVLDIVRELDLEDFGAIQRLCELCEKLENWPRVAEHLAQLLEVEGDEEEVSRMTRRLAEILADKVGKSDEALAALMGVADAGDQACRDEYVALGDKLGWKGVVATKLVEWHLSAPGSPARNEALRGAFDRFVGVGRLADAASVGRELSRSRGADAELATELERIAIELKDLDALGVAHDLLVAELSGPARAEEMVRQAEILVQAGVDPSEAIQHGEQALTSVPPAEVEPLIARLAKLAPEPGAVIDLYERQVTRCKNPQDKIQALSRAARIAASHDAFDRARAFLDLLLSGSFQEETVGLLEDAARAFDNERGGDRLRRTLAEALAAGGQGSRDGGRTRGAMLGRAGLLAFQELEDVELAFKWLGDAVIAHVDEERLDALESVADELSDPKRAEAVIGRALEEVFDGPLVRKLLARRASIRQSKLSDVPGAAADLKRLHDLSPSDQGVVDQLLGLYTELGDHKGMVQLYEDQILRGKDPALRAELARKVARLWEEQLSDPREAADAWRRVLRMKPGDPEGTEGLERAKTNMLKRPKESLLTPLPEVPKVDEAKVDEAKVEPALDELKSEAPPSESPLEAPSEPPLEAAKAETPSLAPVLADARSPDEATEVGRPPLMQSDPPKQRSVPDLGLDDQTVAGFTLPESAPPPVATVPPAPALVDAAPTDPSALLAALESSEPPAQSSGVEVAIDLGQPPAAEEPSAAEAAPPPPSSPSSPGKLAPPPKPGRKSGPGAAPPPTGSRSAPPPLPGSRGSAVPPPPPGARAGAALPPPSRKPPPPPVVSGVRAPVPPPGRIPPPPPSRTSKPPPLPSHSAPPASGNGLIEESDETTDVDDTELMEENG